MKLVLVMMMVTMMSQSGRPRRHVFEEVAGHLLIFFLKDFIYFFMRHRERGRDIGRGRSRLSAGSLI